MPEPEVLPGQRWRYMGRAWLVGRIGWHCGLRTALCYRCEGTEWRLVPVVNLALYGRLLIGVEVESHAAVDA